MPDDLAQFLVEAADVFSIPIDVQQSWQFLHYARILDEWNRTINLTAIEDVRDVIIKHFIDSLAPLRFGLLPDDASILDIGAGAGFPSIPLRILRPDLRVTVLEPNSKKSSFLLYVIGTFHLSKVVVLGQTLKQFAKQSQCRFDCALVRALALNMMGKELADVLDTNGTVLAYRSAVMKSDDIPLGLMSKNEWRYELPFNYGSRVLAELGLANQNVPRGTRKLA